MPDPSPTPNSQETPTPPPGTPPPEPAKPKRTRSEINKKFLVELHESEACAAAALDPVHIPGLTEVEFDATLPGQITILADDLKQELAKLKDARTGKGELTDEEKTARAHLLAIISIIQGAARRKFEETAPARLAGYYIGANISTKGKEELITDAGNILARLVPSANAAPPEDVLLGIKPLGRIQELADAIAAYDDSDLAQGGKQTEAEKVLERVNNKITALGKLRRQIQLAANQAFPWTDEGVATIRKAFHLPPDGPLTA